MFCFEVSPASNPQMFLIFWPFVIFNIVCMPPKYVKSKQFDEKYGTLVEDIKVKGALWKRCYYPLFVYERLVITGMLVILYAYPVHQLVLVLIIQLMVSRQVLTYADDRVYDQVQAVYVGAATTGRRL